MKEDMNKMTSRYNYAILKGYMLYSRYDLLIVTIDAILH